MGKHSHDDRSHEAFTAKRAHIPKEQIFTQSGCHPSLNPFGIKFRECRDSAVNPEALGIMWGLDCTGSMDTIPHLLATDQMPKFMRAAKRFVPYPQPLMGGVGDQRGGDVAPCQVGQFECQAELIDKCLTNLDINQNGFGNGGESYELFFYAAARHTAMDCWEKRRQRGYLFITGDDNAFPAVLASEVRAVFGDRIKEDIPTKRIVEEACEKFHAFFLIPDQFRRQRCERSWRDLLGDNVICLHEPADTSFAAAAIIGLTERSVADLDGVAEALKSLQVSDEQAQRVILAIEPYAASIGQGGEIRKAKRRPRG